MKFCQLAKSWKWAFGLFFLIFINQSIESNAEQIQEKNHIPEFQKEIRSELN